MKRPGPIKRKPEHQLKRSGPIKRAKPINRVSKKRRKLMAATTPARAAYRKEFPLCQCGCGRTATDIHEITSGAARESALSCRETWLHLARPCHNRIQGWPVLKQCALKFIVDPHYLNMGTISRLRMNDPNEFCTADIAPHLKLA